MKQRTSLARRLMTVQVLVIGLGITTLIVAAGLLTPRLFSQHLYEAGESDPAVQGHAMQALSSSLAIGVLLALVVSVSAAVVASWLLARRVAQPLERLAEAAGGVESGALEFVDETRFTSEMSQLFDSLEDMSARLERASANRNQLMSDLSHELRTPLATLEAHVDALEDGMIAPTVDTYRAMRDQISRLRRLAMDVRVAAAAQEHALELHPVRTDAGRLAVGAHATAAPRYAAKGVDLELNVSDDPMVLQCDEERVQQVLANLLDNALRHTPASGSVYLSARPAGTDALLIVEDTGAGLAPGQLQRIFERFYRVDSSRSTFDGSGSGLGLTIAQAIVADHGGTITAYSDGIGKGSRFTIALPLDVAGA
jgi:two-component system, OmpR family, sensor histidine kinase BaeS